MGTQQLSRDRTAGLENPTQTHEPGGGERSVTEEGGQRDIMTDTLLHLPQKLEDGAGNDVTPELTVFQYNKSEKLNGVL